MLHAARRLILARTETGGAFEQPLQVERTEAHLLAELRQRDYAFRVVEHLPCAQHVLRLLGDLRRLATQAGTIACTFGLSRIGEEFHRLAPRTAAGTRRPAKDSRGAHREDEAAVLPGIPRQHLLPFVLKFGLHVHSVAPSRWRRYPALAGKAIGSGPVTNRGLRTNPRPSHAPRYRAGSP